MQDELLFLDLHPGFGVKAVVPVNVVWILGIAETLIGTVDSMESAG